MNRIPSKEEIHPATWEDLEQDSAVDLLFGKDFEEAYQLLCDNSSGAIHEALYYMGPVARTYYLPVLERYVNEYYEEEDLLLVMQIITDCELVLLFSESDQVEYPNFLILRRCLDFIIDYFIFFRANSENWDQSKIDEVHARLLTQRQELEKRIENTFPYFPEKGK